MGSPGDSYTGGFHSYWHAAPVVMFLMFAAKGYFMTNATSQEIAAELENLEFFLDMCEERRIGKINFEAHDFEYGIDARQSNANNGKTIAYIYSDNYDLVSL